MRWAREQLTQWATFVVPTSSPGGRCSRRAVSVLGPSTRRRKLSAVSSLFRYRCNANAVEENPVSGVKRPRMENANEGRTSALSDAQARRLLSAPEGDSLPAQRDRALLAVLLYHGLRRDEAEASGPSPECYGTGGSNSCNMCAIVLLTYWGLIFFVRPCRTRISSPAWTSPPLWESVLHDAALIQIARARLERWSRSDPAAGWWTKWFLRASQAKRTSSASPARRMTIRDSSSMCSGTTSWIATSCPMRGGQISGPRASMPPVSLRRSSTRSGGTA